MIFDYDDAGSSLNKFQQAILDVVERGVIHPFTHLIIEI